MRVHFVPGEGLRSSEISAVRDTARDTVCRTSRHPPLVMARHTHTWGVGTLRQPDGPSGNRQFADDLGPFTEGGLDP
jgi:hypothetical protein